MDLEAISTIEIIQMAISKLRYIGWVCWFNGMSTFVSYLMSKLLLSNCSGAIYIHGIHVGSCLSLVYYSESKPNSATGYCTYLLPWRNMVRKPLLFNAKSCLDLMYYIDMVCEHFSNNILDQTRSHFSLVK